MFNFENKPSVFAISRKNRKQLYEERGRLDIEDIQNEVFRSTPCTGDKEDAHADMDTSVQCQLLTDQKCFISMFISNPKAIKYFIRFDDYDYFSAHLSQLSKFPIVIGFFSFFLNINFFFKLHILNHL